MEINPWSNETYDDYQKLLDEFGIAPFSFHNLPNPPKLIRRGVVFGERGFEIIEKAILEVRNSQYSPVSFLPARCTSATRWS